MMEGTDLKPPAWFLIENKRCIIGTITMYLNDGDYAIAIYTTDSSGVVRMVTKGEAGYGQALGGFYNQELVSLNSIEGI